MYLDLLLKVALALLELLAQLVDVLDVVLLAVDDDVTVLQLEFDNLADLGLQRLESLDFGDEFETLTSLLLAVESWALEAAEEGGLVLAAELLLQISQILDDLLSLLIERDADDVLQVLVKGHRHFLNEIANRLMLLYPTVDCVTYLYQVFVHHLEFFVKLFMAFQLRNLVKLWTAFVLIQFLKAKLVLRIESLALEGTGRVPRRLVLLFKYHALVVYVVPLLDLVKIIVLIEHSRRLESIAAY